MVRRAARGVLLAGVLVTGPVAAGDTTLAVIPKGTTHEFWKAIHAGAAQAAHEHGVQIIWKGPLKEDDREAQIAEVENFVGRGVQGIVLAPLDDAALRLPVLNAVQSGIPVVIIDSDLQGDSHISFVATDNYRGGRLAGEHLAGLLGGTGRVVMLRYQEGSASTMNRERGFTDAVAAFPGVQVASANQYGGATTESAYRASENLLAPYRLPGGGLGIIYISHFLEEVQEVADTCTVLRDGRNVWKGAMAGVSAASLVEAMVGRRVEELFPRSARQPGEAVLEVTDLAGGPRPQQASLVLRRGEVLGIAGLVGAGRTELLRLLFGLEPIRRGRVRLGIVEGPASPRQRWAQGMGLHSEDRQGEGLATVLSVADNLTLSRLDGLGPWGLVLPPRQRRAAERWIGQLQVRCAGARAPVASLSGGNQQKVALARLLHHDVDVLLLDEPTRGIDVGSKAQIYALIDALACQGKAVLLVSSYLPELLGVADRIAVMCRGLLGPARPVAQFDEHSLMLAATGQAPS
ncbi:MAG: substrate-binding domain-containing protein [Candidatus Latescibacterota bacterium]